MCAYLWEWFVVGGARHGTSGVCMTCHGAMEALSRTLIEGGGSALGKVVRMALVDSAREAFYLRGIPVHIAECQAGIIHWRRNIGDMLNVRKSLLKSDADEAREQAEEIAHAFAPPHEYEAGKRLRALAVELVKQEMLGVRLVSYEDGAQELEVFRASKPHRDVVIITRNKFGDQCQMTWEQSAGIKDETEIQAVANMVAAVLSNSASASSDYAQNREHSAEGGLIHDR